MILCTLRPLTHVYYTGTCMYTHTMYMHMHGLFHRSMLLACLLCKFRSHHSIRLTCTRMWSHVHVWTLSYTYILVCHISAYDLCMDYWWFEILPLTIPIELSWVCKRVWIQLSFALKLGQLLWIFAYFALYMFSCPKSYQHKGIDFPSSTYMYMYIQGAVQGVTRKHMLSCHGNKCSACPKGSNEPSGPSHKSPCRVLGLIHST